MRWGLIPFFTKALSDVKGISTINARAETVATSGTYRQALQRRRCIVPASGFYEWKKLDAKSKQPFRFDLANGQPFAFAGLWEAWKEPKRLPSEIDHWLQSYTIITTEPNQLTAQIHTRMPFIPHPRATTTAGSAAMLQDVTPWLFSALEFVAFYAPPTCRSCWYRDIPAPLPDA